MMAIIRRELKSFLTGPFGYVIAGLFSLLLGLWFFQTVIASKDNVQELFALQVFKGMLGTINLTFMLICPLITMGEFAQESKNNTLDLLMMSPLTNLEILAAKFIACMGMCLFILFFTLVFPIVISFAAPMDWSVVATSYLGLIMNTAMFVAIGLFCSTLTDNQLVAGILSICVLFVFLLFVLTGASTDNPLVAQVFQYLSPAYHFESLSRGAIKIYHVIYYLSVVFLACVLSLKSLESKTW